MSPFIKDEDSITLSPLERTAPRLGDVIAFTQGEGKKLTIHRVVGRKGGSFLLKGDNLYGKDGWISQKDILGSVTRVERKGRGIRFGLGPERLLLALLSRQSLLSPIIFTLWKLIPAPKKSG
jgi:hypothetical protein